MLSRRRAPWLLSSTSASTADVPSSSPSFFLCCRNDAAISSAMTTTASRGQSSFAAAATRLTPTPSAMYCSHQARAFSTTALIKQQQQPPPPNVRVVTLDDALHEAIYQIFERDLRSAIQTAKNGGGHCIRSSGVIVPEIARLLPEALIEEMDEGVKQFLERFPERYHLVDENYMGAKQQRCYLEVMGGVPSRTGQHQKRKLLEMEKLQKAQAEFEADRKRQEILQKAEAKLKAAGISVAPSVVAPIVSAPAIPSAPAIIHKSKMLRTTEMNTRNFDLATSSNRTIITDGAVVANNKPSALTQTGEAKKKHLVLASREPIARQLHMTDVGDFRRRIMAVCSGRKILIGALHAAPIVDEAFDLTDNHRDTLLKALLDGTSIMAAGVASPAASRLPSVADSVGKSPYSLPVCLREIGERANPEIKIAVGGGGGSAASTAAGIRINPNPAGNLVAISSLKVVRETRFFRNYVVLSTTRRQQAPQEEAAPLYHFTAVRRKQGGCGYTMPDEVPSSALESTMNMVRAATGGAGGGGDAAATTTTAGEAAASTNDNGGSAPQPQDIDDEISRILENPDTNAIISGTELLFQLLFGDDVTPLKGLPPRPAADDAVNAYSWLKMEAEYEEELARVAKVNANRKRLRTLLLDSSVFTFYCNIDPLYDRLVDENLKELAFEEHCAGVQRAFERNNLTTLLPIVLGSSTFGNNPGAQKLPITPERRAFLETLCSQVQEYDTFRFARFVSASEYTPLHSLVSRVKEVTQADPLMICLTSPHLFEFKEQPKTVFSDPAFDGDESDFRLTGDERRMLGRVRKSFADAVWAFTGPAFSLSTSGRMTHERGATAHLYKYDAKEEELVRNGFGGGVSGATSLNQQQQQQQHDYNDPYAEFGADFFRPTTPAVLHAPTYICSDVTAVKFKLHFKYLFPAYNRLSQKELVERERLLGDISFHSYMPVTERVSFKRHHRVIQMLLCRKNKPDESYYDPEVLAYLLYDVMNTEMVKAVNMSRLLPPEIAMRTAPYYTPFLTAFPHLMKVYETSGRRPSLVLRADVQGPPMPGEDFSEEAVEQTIQGYLYRFKGTDGQGGATISRLTNILPGFVYTRIKELGYTGVKHFLEVRAAQGHLFTLTRVYNPVDSTATEFYVNNIDESNSKNIRVATLPSADVLASGEDEEYDNANASYEQLQHAPAAAAPPAAPNANAAPNGTGNQGMNDTQPQRQPPSNSALPQPMQQQQQPQRPPPANNPQQQQRPLPHPQQRPSAASSSPPQLNPFEASADYFKQQQQQRRQMMEQRQQQQSSQQQQQQGRYPQHSGQQQRPPGAQQPQQRPPQQQSQQQQQQQQRPPSQQQQQRQNSSSSGGNNAANAGNANVGGGHVRYSEGPGRFALDDLIYRPKSDKI